MLALKEKSSFHCQTTLTIFCRPKIGFSDAFSYIFGGLKASPVFMGFPAFMIGILSSNKNGAIEDRKNNSDQILRIIWYNDGLKH